MIIHKLGSRYYVLRCIDCGAEEEFFSKEDARKFIYEETNGWIYVEQEGTYCSSCRKSIKVEKTTYRFQFSNGKSFLEEIEDLKDQGFDPHDY
ncbi:hypothetical protein TREPR_2035 [Treponema primitia ZAS-2]|uniref:Uncharacterized protein n=1 Tax=Treponema primitia (strain ATCC BAA-887 / DSM 12427 / ZAS-2) TaxID=545694 RepID=F5YJU9_TREPZ|nr:hypothetical protein [Treponema primitia]AEF86843.1 hypothetical protein TREPR_2035 [Treponema primitia ZAS-2]